MEIEENIEKLEKKVEKQSLAMELLEFSKEQNRQLEKINKRLIIVLIIILLLWFASIGLFIYYINTTGYEVVTETADTEGEGNACVGDKCNNGEINYGKGN